MAGIVGNVIWKVEAGNDNPGLSADLDENTEAVFQNDLYDYKWLGVSGAYSWNRPGAANNWGIIGTKLNSFKNDFYERIHILPTRIELGTVASTITRTIAVWNAYTELDATLGSILLSNGTGISIVGAAQPTSFEPLQERTWTVRITPNGPPQINAQILFDFTDVADPIPVVIIGNRAVVVQAIPEVPLTEKWKWLTDVQVSVDGTEQRVGILKVPRRSLSTKLVFDTEQELRDQYTKLLGASGRLFIPYYQYGTMLTVAAVAGTSTLSFETATVDLRAGDYVLLLNGDVSALIQLSAVGNSNATTQAPLSNSWGVGTKVIAIFASIVPNELSLNRPAVNNYGTMSMSSTATAPRSSHVRPGATETLDTLDGFVILNRRPLANDEIGYSFDTGQEILDAQTGLFDVTTDWDMTQVNIGYEFQVARYGYNRCTHRSGVQEMDYWRLFTDTMKGSLNNFLLSTYRSDQIPGAVVGVGANSMILAGASYAESFWGKLPYHYIAITTAAGVHFAKVTAATKQLDNNTSITFTPALPSQADWTDVKYISYLLKQRISDDTVELSHYALDTIFKFNARTVAE